MKTNTTELILNFRSALIALAPCMRKLEIPINLPASYDAWDEITEKLYEHMVSELLRYSLPLKEMAYFKIPMYEVFYDSYVDMSLIEVLLDHGKKSDDRYYVFSHFVSVKNDFDYAEVVPVTKHGSPDPEPKHFKVEEISFQLLYKNNNHFSIIRDLMVDDNKSWERVTHIYVTNEKGDVVKDITQNRTKPVIPGLGFAKRIVPTPPDDFKMLSMK